MTHILLIDDDPAQRLMLSLMLRKKLHATVTETTSAKHALAVLQRAGADIQLILVDQQMPEMTGIEFITIARDQYPDKPIIMLTGSTDIKIAVEAIQKGAVDFLTKPPDLGRLHVSITNALTLTALHQEVNRLKQKKDHANGFNTLIGYGGSLSHIVKTGLKAAQSDAPVLLLGETGVGKEVFAAAIHNESKRSHQPFIAVNCGALPAPLVESILFGHEKGAFTGAIQKSLGHFREAEGGTIFLDEIGELPTDAQVKILRVLQQKEITPVGSSQSVKINVRIISATHRNLEDDVKQGRFREDLFFRLNVLPIHLPSLRDRKEDIPALARHFIMRTATQENLTIKDISDDALAHLMQHPWRGNVRELENTIHRALILSEQPRLEIADFDTQVKLASPTVLKRRSAAIATAQESFINAKTGQLKTMAEIENDAMKLALILTDNNITKAAALLGIAKSTFYRKLSNLINE